MGEESLLSETIREDLLEDTSFLLVIKDQSGGFDTQTVIENPYSFDLGRYVPNPPIDYKQFVDLAADVIANAQARAEIELGQRIQLVKDYNPEQFGEYNEVITIKILNRSPARMSTDGKSRQVFGLRTSYEFQDPNYPNKVLEVQERPLDHRVEFCVWAKTSTLADSRALWLERLFVQDAWVFKSKGASLFFWESRGPDTFWQHAGARLHQRPLVFKLRLHEYSVISHPTIKQFNLSLKNIIPE
jgi:hypothetical protein